MPSGEERGLLSRTAACNLGILKICNSEVCSYEVFLSTCARISLLRSLMMNSFCNGCLQNKLVIPCDLQICLHVKKNYSEIPFLGPRQDLGKIKKIRQAEQLGIGRISFTKPISWVFLEINSGFFCDEIK